MWVAECINHESVSVAATWWTDCLNSLFLQMTSVSKCWSLHKQVLGMSFLLSSWPPQTSLHAWQLNLSEDHASQMELFWCSVFVIVFVPLLMNETNVSSALNTGDQQWLQRFVYLSISHCYLDTKKTQSEWPDVELHGIPAAITTRTHPLSAVPKFKKPLNLAKIHLDQWQIRRRLVRLWGPKTATTSNLANYYLVSTWSVTMWHQHSKNQQISFISWLQRCLLRAVHAAISVD